jgi:hypothetical protein
MNLESLNRRERRQRREDAKNQERLFRVLCAFGGEMILEIAP